MSSDTPSRQEKAARIRHLLETEGDAVFENTRTFNEGRYDSTGRLDDYEELKQEARDIKEGAISNLDSLIDQVTTSVEANGGTVYLADDAEDAREYVAEVARGRGADTVVKSKSMTTEEVELNDRLQADGTDVWETDLGEFVLQVADEAPSHIVAPAIHHSREEIATLFNDHFDPDEPLETAEDLTRFASDYLADRIDDAQVGITGANFVVAESGSLALVTSEGNARKTVAATDTHVAVAGIEKLLPRVEDLQPFVELIGRSGTGQDITSYVSLLTPPVDTPVLEPGTPLSQSSADGRDFHLVLLDNGRDGLRDDDQLRETLYCIRCSACLNSCANFQHVGGHAFGGETYSGGIGTGWEYATHGSDSAADFNDLCTGCSRCVDQCPVGIDIPWINTVVRDRLNHDPDTDPDTFDHLVGGLTPDEEPTGLDLQKRVFGNIGTLARLGSATAPVSNWLADTTPTQLLLERVAGIDRRRDLPRFQRETLVDWFDARGPRVDPADATREAVIYPDVYTNHVSVERGKAAVRTLEALDVHVTVADAGESGRAPLSQGMISTAETNCRAVYDVLEPHLDVGRDIVVVEPSDVALFRREAEKLLPEADAERLAAESYEVLEYVYGLLENGADSTRLRSADSAGEDGTDVAYHSHCQQRTLGLEEHTVAVLERLGHDVATSDVECCGMAGSFGYKVEYYDLSMDVGDELATQFSETETENRQVVASGTSCLEQLDALLTRRPTHPIELIAPE